MNKTLNSSALLTAVRNLLVEHEEYRATKSYLTKQMTSAIQGDAQLDLLLATSRYGKSTLIKQLLSVHPRHKVEGRWKVPVVGAVIQSGSEKDVPCAVLRALRIPHLETAPYRTLMKDMALQVEKAGVRYIIFDEVSNLVEEGLSVSPRKAATVFKDIYNGEEIGRDPKVGFLLVGVPRLARILTANEQLRTRANRPTTAWPYRWDLAEDRRNFAGCVKAFINVLISMGVECEVDFNTIVREVYATTGGVPGRISDWFVKVSRAADSRLLRRAALYAASQSMNLPGSGCYAPFGDEAADDELLMYLHSAELAASELSPKPIARS